MLCMAHCMLYMLYIIYIYTYIYTYMYIYNSTYEDRNHTNQEIIILHIHIRKYLNTYSIYIHIIYCVLHFTCIYIYIYMYTYICTHRTTSCVLIRYLSLGSPDVRPRRDRACGCSGSSDPARPARCRPWDRCLPKLLQGTSQNSLT